MRALRVLALALNAGWLLVGTGLGLGAVVGGLGLSMGIPMALLSLTAITSGLVILRDLWPGRIPATPVVVRAIAVALNTAWLFFATIGWSTAVTGRPAPGALGPAALAAAFTVALILNLLLILRPPALPGELDRAHPAELT